MSDNELYAAIWAFAAIVLLAIIAAIAIGGNIESANVQRTQLQEVRACLANARTDQIKCVEASLGYSDNVLNSTYPTPTPGQ